MSEKSSVNVLEQLTESDAYHTAIFFSYGADLGFYEQALLGELRRNDCRNHLLFVDSERYQDTVDVFRESCLWVGRRYALVPVFARNFRSFHAKLVLLVGREQSRLLVGSGNLTFTGFGRNHELFSTIDWKPERPGAQQVFQDVWRLVNEMASQARLSRSAGTMMRKAERTAGWTEGQAPPAENIWFLHSMERSLLSQLRDRLGGEKVRRLQICAPFFTTSALNALIEQFEPDKVEYILQDGETSGEAEALAEIAQTDGRLSLFTFDDEERYLHAKSYLFETEESTYLLTGSANCTGAALLEPFGPGNLETALLRRSDSPDDYRYLFAGRISPLPAEALSQVTLKPLKPETDGTGRPRSVLLEEATLEDRILHVRYELSETPEPCVGLCLMISGNNQHMIKLSAANEGINVQELEVTKDLLKEIDGPASAVIKGLDEDDRPIDLGCNKLWLMQVNELRRAAGREIAGAREVRNLLLGEHDPERDEWQTIHNSLAELVEREASRVSRRGPRPWHRAAGSKKAEESTDEGGEHETEVILVDVWEDEESERQEEEAQAELERETGLHTLIELVVQQLPARKREGGATRKDGVDDGNGKRKSRPRWTPDRRLKRRFKNLLRKYVAGLQNEEYMASLPAVTMLDGYRLFQILIWPLTDNKFLDESERLSMMMEINAAFFGDEPERPPVFSPCQSYQIRRSESDTWIDTKAGTFALASLLSCQELAARLQDDEALVNLERQELVILTSLAVVGDGLSDYIGTHESVRAAAQAFDLDEVTLLVDTEELIERRVGRVKGLLKSWIDRVAFGLSELKGGTVPVGEMERVWEQRLRYQANVDYRAALFHLLTGDEVEEKLDLCGEIAFWYRRASKSQEAQEWDAKLVELAQRGGDPNETAKALLRQSLYLLHENNYIEANNKAQQALSIAESLGDEGLIRDSKLRVDTTKFFIRDGIQT